MAHDVLISYARANSQLKNWLRWVLIDWQVSVWHDRGEIGSGEWREQIDQAIRECKLVLIVWSKEYSESKECYWEYTTAQWHKKKILPLWFEDCEIPSCFGDLKFKHRINYFDGNHFQNHNELLNLLQRDAIGKDTKINLFSINPPPPIREGAPAPPTGSKTGPTVPEAPDLSTLQDSEVRTAAVDSEPASKAGRMPPPTSKRITIPDLVGLLGLTPSTAVNHFFSCTGSVAGDAQLASTTNQYPPPTGVPWLLADGQFERAAQEAGEELWNTISFESLRAAIVSHLVWANQSTTDLVRATANTAVAVTALRHSATLWTQWSPTSQQAPGKLVPVALDAVDAALKKLAGGKLGDQKNDRSTHGLALRELLVAEEKSAAVLEQLGGVIIESEEQPQVVAFGYGFASQFGSKYNLLRRAAEMERKNSDCRYWFSPLFPFIHRLEEQNYEQFLNEPPPQIRDSSDPLYRPAVNLLVECAMQAIESGLQVGRIPFQLKTVRRAMDCLEDLKRRDRGSGDAFAERLAAILLSVADRVEEAKPTPYEATELMRLFCGAEERFGHTIHRAHPHLQRALLRHRARFALEERQYKDAIRLLDDSQQSGVPIRADDLCVRIRAWLGLHERNVDGALDHARQLVEQLEKMFSQYEELPHVREELKLRVLWDGQIKNRPAPPPPDTFSEELAKRRRDLENPPTYEAARDEYRITPHVMAKVHLLAAIELEAKKLMETERGVVAVIEFMRAVRDDFPDLKEIKELPRELARQWLGKYAAHDMDRLMNALTEKKNEVAPRVKTGTPMNANPKPVTDEHELLAQSQSSQQKMDEYFNKFRAK